MPVEFIPKFTAPAAKLWERISTDAHKDLLSNVWCGKCRQATTISGFSGAIRGGNLLLVGKCTVCLNDVSRVIEFEDRDDGTYVLLGPPRLTEQEALDECEKVRNECQAFEKRRRQLSRKWNNGTSSKSEEAEMNRLFGKEGDAMLLRLRASAMQLAQSFRKK